MMQWTRDDGQRRRRGTRTLVNTRLVVLSTTILGLASGLVGTFLLLRRRALLADALSHAMLPGIAIAFMVMVPLPV